MRMNLKRLFVISGIVSISFFIGCGEKQKALVNENNIEVSVPWVDYCNSEVNRIKKMGGLAECACEETNKITNNFSMTIAENKARQKLAQDLKVRIKGLFKGHQDKTKVENKSMNGERFENTIRQIVNNNIYASVPVSHKIFHTQNDTYEMCSVVAFEPDKIKNVLKELSNETGIGKVRSNELLYEEFMADKAQKELKEELKNE
jgi:hypothetical protein